MSSPSRPATEANLRACQWPWTGEREPPLEPGLPPASWSRGAEAPGAPHFIWLVTQAQQDPWRPRELQDPAHHAQPWQGQLHFQTGAVRGQGQGRDVRGWERRARGQAGPAGVGLQPGQAATAPEARIPGLWQTTVTRKTQAWPQPVSAERLPWARNSANADPSGLRGGPFGIMTPPHR